MGIDDHYVFISDLTVADLSNGHDAKGDIKEETHQVMRELERMLNQEGSLADVVSVDIHLADLKDLNAMNTFYTEFFKPSCYPARTCTESPSMCSGSRLEITLMAKCVSE